MCVATGQMESFASSIDWAIDSLADAQIDSPTFDQEGAGEKRKHYWRRCKRGGQANVPPLGRRLKTSNMWRM